MMTNNAQKIVEEIDEIAEGFRKVPVVMLPPNIKWGEEFKEWDDEKKISYLMKFCEAMNHAAATIQDERNALGELLEKKEDRIQQLEAALEANNLMLQTEITKMNEDKQKRNAHVIELNKRIRELESGNIS
jgi:hypothetical protein